MDSTAGQILLPLAAGGISAYSPRYGGAGVAGALGAARTLNDRRISDFRMNQAKQEEAHSQEQSQAYRAAIDRAVQSGQLGADEGMAYAFAGPSGAMRLADRLKPKDATPQQPHWESNLITNEYGDQVRDLYDTTSGTQKQVYVSGPKPEKEGREQVQDWGYGQKRIVRPDGTTEIVKVPTAPREDGVGGGLLGKHSPEEIKNLADAIEQGNQIPDFKALYGAGAPLKAELQRRGINVFRLQREADAIKRHVSTMNGPQMVRLGQTIDFADHSLDMIQDLYNKWNQLGYSTQFKGFNKFALSAAAATGGDAGAIANTLLAQIGDLTSELGTIYKGGNASTDESLRLASQNLNASWDEKSFSAAIGAIRRNIGMRAQAMNNSQASGVRPDSPYNQGKGASPVSADAQTEAKQEQGAGGVSEGTIIFNPQTKQRLRLQGGAWVPVQ